MIEIIHVKLTKSLSGRLRAHRECLKGLGFSKIGQVKSIKATKENLGMINKVSYMLKIEKV